VTLISAQQPALFPDRDCSLCPRLVEYRHASRRSHPDWHNAPVPSFGELGAALLIVGLAPGLKGANRTGRPFTGDAAGDLLYSTLLKYGLANGEYRASPDDGLSLHNCRIANAVRCVPPQNKVVAAEINACRPFLRAEIAAMPNLKVIIALGGIAHGAILPVFGLQKASRVFAHEACHQLPGEITLIDSYHCSRYNTNTGRLTEAMFHSVFERSLPLI